MEVVRLVTERGLTVARACRDLDAHENVVWRWRRAFTSDPAQDCPGARPAEARADGVQEAAP